MNKEKILEIIRTIYTDVSFISEEELEQIITLYSNQLEKDKLNYHISRDEKNYALTDEVRILKSMFEVIRNNNSLSFWDRYKLEQLYEKKLEKVLEFMDKEEEKHRPPKTPAMASVNDYDIVQNSGPRRIFYEFLPDYSTTLADMCADQMKHSEAKIIESKETEITLPSLKKFKEIDLSLKGRNIGYSGNVSISEESKKIANETADMITQTEQRNIQIEQQKIDAERQKKEIELIQLQQEINRIENEKLEIEKRIKQIYSETLGSFFSEQVSEKYPTEYQVYQQHIQQVKGYSSNYGQITDLKEKFNRISQDLQFYQGVLPAYESFYQRFEQMKAEREKARTREDEQERIYNLIHSEENERLRMSNSLYTAWDLGNKTIPIKYQGKTYEQVEAMLIQEKEAERLRTEAKATREDLINKAIRKDLGVNESYHLSEVQIRNLRVQFDGYSDEELRDFIAGVTKEPEVKPINNGERRILQRIDLSPALDEVEKNGLINEILQMMYPNGLDYVPLPDIKRQLDARSIQELQEIKNQLISQSLETTVSKSK